MEALILIFGELIAAILMPFIVAVVDFIAAIIAGIASLFGWRRKRVPAPDSGDPTTSESPRRRNPLAAKLMTFLFAIGVLMLLAVFVINQVYFADSVRMVFAKLETRSGIVTECAAVDGNLFAGRIELKQCSIEREANERTGFDLTVDRVELDLRLLSLFGTAEVQKAHVAGLAGSVNRQPPLETEDEEPVAEKPRRAFVIRDLKIADADLLLSGYNKDGGEFELPVRIESANSAPLRSRYALFDILFRSNVAGQVAGAEFEIVTSGDDAGRSTRWRADAVPVAKFGAMAGGALSWFQGGVVDVDVEDRWARKGALSFDIDMDWKLAFRDVEVQAPDSAGVVTRLASGPIVRYVNSYEGDFPFEFSMTLNEDQFRYQSSLAAAGLWTAVGESVNRVLAAFSVDVVDTAAETGEKLKDGAKSILDRVRGGGDEQIEDSP